MSSGEAATAAMPFLSWQGVFVGDPLFRPFKTGLDVQMRAIDSGSADALSQYSVIRMMNGIAREKGGAAAFDFGSKYVGKIPDGALLWKLSQIAAAEGNSAESVRLASDALGRDLYSEPSNRGLAMEICRYLIPRGGAQAAKAALERLAELSDSGEYADAVASLARGLSKHADIGGKLSKAIARSDAMKAEAERAKAAGAPAGK